jgi:PAP2 superfamily
LRVRSRALLVLIAFAAAGASPAAAGERQQTPLFGSDAAPVSSVIGTSSFEGLFAPALDSLTPALSFDRDYQTQKPPEPEHTGFSALVRKTGGDFKAFPMRRSTWVILGIGGAAAAIAYPFDDDVNDALEGNDTLEKIFKPGKYLGSSYVQMGAAVGTYLIGRYGMKSEHGRTNKVSHLGFDLLRAQILAQALTYGIKYAVQRDRPNGQCCSFPSGHASVTFATASVLERHFGYRAAWPTFVIAGYVAASRLTENVHFLSDVLFGSALGIASGWTVVGRHGRQDFALYPVPTRGGVAIAGMWSPGAGSHGEAGR